MPKRILVVEDEQEIRKDIIRTLDLSNYFTIDAFDGADGLAKAKEQKPDLIISDIMMPKLDGYGLLRELQKNPETASIPFLFLTAKNDHMDLRKGMNLGADDFITKPYDIEELLSAIEVRLEKYDKSEQIHEKKYKQLRSSINKSMPHEIRTPLSLILGYSDYLLKKIDHTSINESKEMLTNIYEAGKRLNRLFENYLCYLNLETNILNPAEIKKIRRKKTYFAELVIKDVAIYHTESLGRRKDLKLDITDSSLNISEENFVKMLKEILDNSIKFSPIGTPIEISSRIKDDYYHICIKDYGRGMAKDQIDNIGAFIQFDRNLYEQQGSGLGFAIVKKICDLHECELKTVSSINEYTEVNLSIPIFKGQ